MGRPSKYPVELRERAARMVAEVRPDHDSEYQAISHVAKLLGVGSPETVRQWIRRMQVDTGARPGATSEAQEEIKRLKRENAERRPYSAIARLPAINDRFRQVTIEGSLKQVIIGGVAGHISCNDPSRWE